MGGGVWSNAVHEERAKTRAVNNIPAFQHHEDVVSGKVTALHEALDPSKMKNGVREARDSAAHPNSVPILFGLDETGSMSTVPRIVQSKLGKLMTTILTKGILADPQILFAAIGDAHTGHEDHGHTPEKAPFQVGQFESGIEMEDDLTRFYLESNGGGQNMESYDLLFYFATHHTVTDAWEKRQRKGYLFLTGDEHAYPTLDSGTIHRVFGGERGTKEYTIEQLVKDAQERYHCFFIIPGGSNHAGSRALHDHWTGLLGAGHVIHLEDPSDICDTVATVIGITEGTLAPTALETLPKAVKAAMDPVITAAQVKIDKAAATGATTARL
jgi:hypothetical protein